MQNQDSAQPARHLLIMSQRTQCFERRRSRVDGICIMPFLLMMVLCAPAWANEVRQRSAEQFADEAKAMWDSGAISPALDTLQVGIHRHPDALMLQTLLGDMLATF